MNSNSVAGGSLAAPRGEVRPGEFPILIAVQSSAVSVDGSGLEKNRNDPNAYDSRTKRSENDPWVVLDITTAQAGRNQQPQPEGGSRKKPVSVPTIHSVRTSNAQNTHTTRMVHVIKLRKCNTNQRNARERLRKAIAEWKS